MIAYRKSSEHPIVRRNSFKVLDPEGPPEPFLDTRQTKKIRTRNMPAPKIILNDKDLRIFCHAIATDRHSGFIQPLHGALPARR
jgi:hypothetical protein